MASDHRKPLVIPKIGTNSDGGFLNPCSLSCNRQTNPFGFCLASCFNVCAQVCKNLISVFDDPLCPPSPPLRPPPPPYLRPVLPSRVTNRVALFTKPAVKFGLIFMAAVITGVFLLGLIWQAWRFYKSRQNDSSRRRNPPIMFHTQESFGDESQGPEIDHPIWYINTVGLQQSIIDSIAICKYKKGEGLIEGTDCSVCLSEFEEDESLRLLPKCSHAFHITCIDTWLRSHKNCPLCRAPIVCNNYAVQAQSSSEPNSIDLDSSEEAEEENVVNNDIALVSEQVGGGETSGLRIGDHNRPAEADNNVQDLRNKSKRSISRNYPSRVQSDLAENRQSSTEGEVQPMRRSVSMDSLSAMRIYNAVANVVPDNHSVGIKNSKSNISSSKRRSGSFGVLKLMSNSSIGPILMKKSSSSCGKASSSSRRNRSHDSILPL